MKKVQTNPTVKELLVLDKIDSSGLYRVKWNESPTDLIDAIAKAEASILHARGDSDWVFRVRFNNHDRLSQFHNYVIDQGITLHIDRTYTLSEATVADDLGITRQALSKRIRQGNEKVLRKALLSSTANFEDTL